LVVNERKRERGGFPRPVREAEHAVTDRNRFDLLPRAGAATATSLKACVVKNQHDWRTQVGYCRYHQSDQRDPASDERYGRTDRPMTRGQKGDHDSDGSHDEEHPGQHHHVCPVELVTTHAEGAGFEPAADIAASDRFQGGSDRPLRHPSWTTAEAVG